MPSLREHSHSILKRLSVCLLHHTDKSSYEYSYSTKYIHYCFILYE